MLMTTTTMIDDNFEEELVCYWFLTPSQPYRSYQGEFEEEGGGGEGGGRGGRRREEEEEEDEKKKKTKKKKKKQQRNKEARKRRCTILQTILHARTPRALRMAPRDGQRGDCMCTKTIIKHVYCELNE